VGNVAIDTESQHPDVTYGGISCVTAGNNLRLPREISSGACKARARVAEMLLEA
jgi:hypothetical protein